MDTIAKKIEAFATEIVDAMNIPVWAHEREGRALAKEVIAKSQGIATEHRNTDTEVRVFVYADGSAIEIEGGDLVTVYDADQVDLSIMLQS